MPTFSDILEKRLYPKLPVWLQGLAVSARGLTYRKERLGGDFRSYVDQFRAREAFTPDQMSAWVDSELRSRMTFAFQNVPHYRDVWKRAGLTLDDIASFRAADLVKLPTLTRTTLQGHPDSLLPEPPHRPGQIVSYYTSGSVGMPIRCDYSAVAHRRFLAAREARSFQWAGCSMLDTRATFGGRKVVPLNQREPPFHRWNMVERQVYLSAHHVARDTAHAYVSALNKYRPTVFTGYGSALLLQARFMLELDLRLNFLPRAVIPTSEALTDEARETLEKAYGAPVFEEYGAVENAALATQCESGSLHVSPDFGVLEILDQDGKPCPAGQEGRVVLTGLLNDAHYLFRYEVGDLGSWSEKTCRCGRTAFPVLAGVFGRSDDFLETDAGPKQFSLAGLFVHVPGLMAAQVVQERRDLLRVRLLVTPAFTDESEKMVESRIQERRLGLRLVFERVSELEKNERGKIRAVIRQI